MKTCENCGERVYGLGCVNCDEQAYMDAAEVRDYEARQDSERQPQTPTGEKGTRCQTR